jgi:hypothetical protein
VVPSTMTLWSSLPPPILTGDKTAPWPCPVPVPNLIAAEPVAEDRGFNPRGLQGPTALAARGTAVPIGSSWTNLLGRSSLDGAAPW